VRNSFLFPTVSMLLHGYKVNTSSAVDVTEPVRFVPQSARLSTLLRLSRMGGCSINLSKDFQFLECRTRAATPEPGCALSSYGRSPVGGTAVVPDRS